MSEAEYRQQEELEAERLTRTLEALGHIEAAGLIEEAEFLASELGVSKFMKQNTRSKAYEMV